MISFYHAGKKLYLDSLAEEKSTPTNTAWLISRVFIQMAVSNTSSKTNHIIHLSQLFNLLQPAMAVITNQSSLTTIELFLTIQVLPCTYILIPLSITLILILDNYWYCSLGNRIRLGHLHNWIGIHIHILNKYIQHTQERYRELQLQQLAYHQTQTS